MEVVESPLNLAHQQSRKADRLLAAGKHEEAITCHGRAADLLTEAMKLTQCEQAQLSLQLQRESHLKQQQLIAERGKRAKREESQRTQPPAGPAEREQALPLQSLFAAAAAARSETARRGAAPTAEEREYDTWLYLLKNKGAPAEPCAGSKALKDDRTRLEEQETALADLRKLVDFLLAENEKLTQENQRLKTENARLKRAPLEREPYADADFVEKSELWGLSQPSEDRKAKDIPIPHLPPLEMPAQDISLEDLPPVELPEDIQNELQELLDRVKL
ncbi:nuclear receptor-binding factor 2b [Lepisosteus oculatus]|uniref:nuclear receptor-binding factor 2b n=1 Tax=Lepisosteus oculatus TaxID=7918 RepID=UPI0037113639